MTPWCQCTTQCSQRRFWGHTRTSLVSSCVPRSRQWLLKAWAWSMPAMPSFIRTEQKFLYVFFQKRDMYIDMQTAEGVQERDFYFVVARDRKDPLDSGHRGGGGTGTNNKRFIQKQNTMIHLCQISNQNIWGRHGERIKSR